MPHVRISRGIANRQAVAILALVFLAGCVLYYVYSQKDSYESDARAAVAAFHSGKFNTVIDKSGKAASLAPTADGVHQAEFLQSMALFGRGESGDVKKGLDILQSIVTSSDANDEIKAVSYGMVARQLIARHPSSEMSVMWSMSPFKEITVGLKGDNEKAAIVLLRHANSLYETVYADYKIAALEGRALSQNAIKVSDPEQQKVAAEIRTYVAAGDTLLASIGVSAMSDIHLFDLYSSRAFALTAISRFSPQVSNAAVYDAYDTAVAVGQAGESAPMYYREQRTRFLLTYALLIQAREPGKHDEKIRQLLKQFSIDAANIPSMAAYVREIQGRPDSNSTKKRFVQLLNVSPEFAAYVKSIGPTS